MLDELRKPFLVIALVLVFLVLLMELGSIAFLGASSSSYGISPTGKAIPALAFVDGILFLHTFLLVMPLLITAQVQIKFQGIAMIVVTVLLLLGCLKLIIKDIVLLILMVSLLFAPLFGTLAYFAIWSDFKTPEATAALSMIMMLKLLFCVFLLLAQQGFLKQKGYVLLIVTALACNLLIAFLYSIVPGPLVSITDAIAAIIVCVLGIIWGLVYLISGIRSTFRAFKQLHSSFA